MEEDHCLGVGAAAHSHGQVPVGRVERRVGMFLRGGVGGIPVQVIEADRRVRGRRRGDEPPVLQAGLGPSRAALLFTKPGFVVEIPSSSRGPQKRSRGVPAMLRA